MVRKWNSFGNWNWIIKKKKNPGGILLKYTKIREI